MRSRYLDIMNGYFNREHPQALPIFDSFGLDNEGRQYFDLNNTSQTEIDKKRAAMARIRIEFVASLEKYGKHKIMYVPCPITSGVRPSIWIREQNETKNFDPEEIYTTTHKINRAMGGELMEKAVVAPNVQDNLVRGAIASQRFPDVHPVLPVIREQGTKQMGRDPNFSNGDHYEGEEYMAYWVPLIDQMVAVQHVPALLHSRNYVHEVMRAVQIQAGLHPSRPDAGIDLVDVNGEPVALIGLYAQMVQVVRSQVGAGIAPREAATAVAQMNDLFDHVQGKSNKISKAREAAGMGAFPDTVHDGWATLTSRDAVEFEAMREEATDFLKKFCLDCMDRRELDDKYDQWHSQGYGQAPAYTDGLHWRLRRKLETLTLVTQDIETFYRRFNPHMQDENPQNIAIERNRLIEFVNQLAHDFEAIEMNRKNGHWNHELVEIGVLVQDAKAIAALLETASVSNHDRIQKLVKDVYEASAQVRNKARVILDDKEVLNLRAEAREVQTRALELTDEIKVKTVDTDPHMQAHMAALEKQMRRYSKDIDPYHDDYEPRIFNDDLFNRATERERAALPFVTGSEEIISPALSHPFTTRISFDPKSSGANGVHAKSEAVNGTKNIFGAAGEDAVQLSKAAAEREEALMAWWSAIRPDKVIYSSANDARLYDTIARHPEAIEKRGGGFRWSTEARLLQESKFTQLRDDEVVFDHGWWRSEHLVQERLRCIQMQLGLAKRPHGTNLRIYTAPEDLSKAPVNPEADSLYESILPLARHVQEEFDAGRPVYPEIALGLIRMCEIHAMLTDTTLMDTRIKNKKDRFNAHEAEISLTSYIRDARYSALGSLKQFGKEEGLYAYLCDPHTGLLAEPEIIRHIPRRALEDAALGDNYKAMQDNAKGKQTLGVVRKPDDGLWHVDVGLHA